MKSIWYSAFLVMLSAVVFGFGVNLAHASTISYPNFSSPSNLNLVGSATQTGNVLRLSEASADSTGAAWHTTKHNVAGGFETVFSFKITEQGQDNFGEWGGDGFAFIIQNTGTSELGTPGFYMGYEIANSLAVEFDTFDNNWWPTAPGMEPNNNHVGIQSRGQAVNTASYDSGRTDAYMGSNVVPANMSDGSVHTAKIIYDLGIMDIFVDDMNSSLLTVPVDLDNLLSLDGGAAYVGFTAGGDTAYENHDVLSWTFESTTPVPIPPAAMLLGSGLILIVGIRRKFLKK